MFSDTPQPVTISIDGIEVEAIHGLLLQERKKPQLFRFDLELQLDSCPGCSSDRIQDTVDYAAVVECVIETAKAASFDLLERLAQEVAAAVLERFGAVARVKVQVAKDVPPLARRVGGIRVSLERGRP